MRFDDFLTEALDGLSRYARVLTGDRQEAHDLVAETLEQVQRQWRRIEPLEHRTAYVRQMLLNRFLSDRRRWSARMVRPTNRLPDTPVDGGLDRISDRAELRGPLASLPRQQRAAIVLRFYLDQSDAEIAQALGCSAGAARTYISRGLARLRIRLDPSVASTSEQT